MENQKLVFDLVNILHKYLKIPVFCKIRIFPKLEDTIAYAKMLEAAGCQVRFLTLKALDTNMGFSC